MTTRSHSRARLRALIALPSLADIAEALFSPADRTAVLDALLTAVEMLVGPSFCMVFLGNSASSALPRAHQRFGVETPNLAPLAPDCPSIVSVAVRTQQAQYLENDGRPSTGAGSLPAQAALPLITQQRLVGVLHITSVHRRVIPERIRPALEGLATIGGVALHRVLALEELRHLAMTDGLTGLANQRALIETLNRELARAARTKETVSIVLIELDRFKHVNDRYGHLRGDEVLRRVAVALNTACRAMDLAVRLGGDEFALMLPGTAKKDALQIADRVRLRIRDIGRAEAVRLTASLGIATVSDGGTPEDLIDIADRAMYRAKRAGGNRVAVVHSATRCRVAQGGFPPA